MVNNSIRKKENIAMKFKPCKGCPTPAQCTAAGKCAKKASGMAAGGMTAKKKKDYMSMGMSKGGMTAKKGYNKGGYCGASNPAERPMKKSS